MKPFWLVAPKDQGVLRKNPEPDFAVLRGVFAGAQAETSFPKKAYSPYAGRNYPTRPLFVDTHLHTGSSFDAGVFGCGLDPADAYGFARGQEVTASSGQPAKLSRPLDFLVVADHSDNMGFFLICLPENLNG